jgi:hypothetical protein
MFEIIQIGGNDGGPPDLDEKAKRTVRSNAMRHYKRKQREARSSGKVYEIMSTIKV